MCGILFLFVLGETRRDETNDLGEMVSICSERTEGVRFLGIEVKMSHTIKDVSHSRASGELLPSSCLAS